MSTYNETIVDYSYKRHEGMNIVAYLRDLFKGKEKKTLLNVLVVFIVGVLLLISSNALFSERAPEPAKSPEPASANMGYAAITEQAEIMTYEERLETRLEEILSQVEGAGKVKAMITFAYSQELVFAEDGRYERASTEETDAQGGKRTVESLSTSGTKITVKGEDGSVSPLILKTIAPRVEGVIITAQGGADAIVKEQLIKAAQTVLGVEPHKVQVFKAKT